MLASRIRKIVIVRLLATITALTCATLTGCQTTPSAPPPPKLSDADVKMILDQAEAAAKAQPSQLRVNAAGEKQTAHAHLRGQSQRAHHRPASMPDAWLGSLNIANMKAFTAICFSSDQNAVSTRTLGALSQPGGPLWNIGNSNKGMFLPGLIEFPGGLPLYKSGVLVGGIGVSGDSVEEDEVVALAGSKGFEAPEAIRVDKVSGGTVPYVK